MKSPKIRETNHLMKTSVNSLRIIYIMGDGRSGSTILSIILGNHPDIASVGELHRWAEFQGQTKPGDEKKENKSFWRAVQQQFYINESAPNFDSLVALQENIEAYQQFFKVLLVRDTQMQKQYHSFLEQLFSSIAEVSERRFVVDETKRPGRAYELLRSQHMETRVIHLVRDPRGVVWSQLKTNVEHKTKHPLKTIMHYNIKNFMSLFVRWLNPKGSVLQVRYEDLIIDPEETLTRIGKFINCSMEPVIKMVGAQEDFWVPNLIDGNRIRKKDYVKLHFDIEWQRKLSKTWKLTTVLLTLPLFLGFGYWQRRYNHSRF